MNLITKLIEKLKTKKQIDLENFDIKYKHNQNLTEKNFKKMQKGVNNLLNRDAIDYYVYDPFGEIETIKSIIMEQTKSKGLSINFSQIVVCAKMFAANYMATDEGKKYKEVKFACERLCEMVDCLNFNFMAHINLETNYSAKFENDSFVVDPDSYASRLLEMINYVNNTMMEIAQGIYNRDKEAVYNAFLGLSDKDLYLFDDGAKEIFDL